MAIAAWIAFGFATLALLVAGGAAWYAWTIEERAGRLNRRDSEALRDEIGALVKKASAELADVADSVEDLIERAKHERRVVDGRRGGRGHKAEPDAPAMTREQYIAHLNAGGRAIPDVERSLGL